jgi:hypothetical protein
MTSSSSWIVAVIVAMGTREAAGAIESSGEWVNSGRRRNRAAVVWMDMRDGRPVVSEKQVLLRPVWSLSLESRSQMGRVLVARAGETVWLDVTSCLGFSGLVASVQANVHVQR